MDESHSLGDLAWLRRLARSLVRDANSAEEVVQETLVAAWRSGKSEHRGWLAQSLRNFVRQEHRSTRRRIEREERSYEERHSPPVDDVLAELELHRQLAQMVADLDEPYRETLLLRFLREWSPKRIADYQSVPVKTVHTRIDRGLMRLRDRLDQRADRDSWIAALVILDAPSTASVPSLITAGSVLVSMQVKVIALLVSIAVVALSVPYFQRSAVPLGASQAGQMTATAPELEAAPTLSPQRERLTAPSDVPVAPRQEVAKQGSRLVMVEGRVQTLTGAPVPDVQVLLESRIGSGKFLRAPNSPSASSDSNGDFTITWDASSPGRLTVDDRHYAPLHRPSLRADRQDELPLVVIVAPRQRYQGHVVDTAGDPVAGARVQATLPGPTIHAVALEDRALALRLPLAEVSTDEFGAFEIACVGYLPGAVLNAQRDGHGSTQIELPEHSELDLLLSLSVLPVEPTTQDPSLSGRVLNASGVAQADARVSLGTRSVITDTDGRFELGVERWREDAVLRAFHPEGGGRVQPLDVAALQSALAGEELTILLPGTRLRLAGTVIDADGNPVPGAVVFTPDTTYFGEAPVESGGAVIWAASTLESLQSDRQGPGDRTLQTTTDEQGRFELAGVLDRTYDLFAMRGTDLRACGPITVHPRDVRTVLRLEGSPGQRIAGRVINESGDPVPMVRLLVGRSLPWERGVGPIDSWSGVPMLPSAAAKEFRGLDLMTDEEGRFSMDDFCLDDAWIGVDELGFFAATLQFADVPDPLSIELVHTRSALVRLKCRPDATSVRLTSLEGGFLAVFVPVEDATMSVPRVPVLEGHALPFITRVGPALVTLENDSGVLEQVPIRIAPGERLVEIEGGSVRGAATLAGAR